MWSMMRRTMSDATTAIIKIIIRSFWYKNCRILILRYAKVCNLTCSTQKGWNLLSIRKSWMLLTHSKYSSTITTEVGASPPKSLTITTLYNWQRWIFRTAPLLSTSMKKTVYSPGLNLRTLLVSYNNWRTHSKI